MSKPETAQPTQTRPNAGPGPVEAKPNHVREKTYVPPNPPERYEQETNALPEGIAQAKVECELPEAVDAIKRRV